MIYFKVLSVRSNLHFTLQEVLLDSIPAVSGGTHDTLHQVYHVDLATVLLLQREILGTGVLHLTNYLHKTCHTMFANIKFANWQYQVLLASLSDTYHSGHLTDVIV